MISFKNGGEHKNTPWVIFTETTYKRAYDLLPKFILSNYGIHFMITY